MHKIDPPDQTVDSLAPPPIEPVGCIQNSEGLLWICIAIDLL